MDRALGEGRSMFRRCGWLLLWAAGCASGARSPDAGGSVVVLAVGSEELRVVETVPGSTAAVERDPLVNFESRIVRAAGGKLELRVDRPVLILERPSDALVVRSNPAFGAQLAGQVNPQIGAGMTPAELARRQEQILALISNAGVGTIRDLQSYDTKRAFLEPIAEGVFDFAAPDLATGLAPRYGLEIVARLSLHREVVPPDWRSGPPSPVAPWLRYLAKVVERYDGDDDLGCELPAPDCYSPGDRANPGGDLAAWGRAHRVSFWETVKEPEPTPRWRPGNDAGLTSAQCRDVLELSASTIRAADPGARVYFSGMGAPFDPLLTVETRESYFQDVVDAGGAAFFDLMGVDAYVDDVQQALATYGGVLAAAGAEKELWVGQTGTDDVPGTQSPYGGTPERQMEFMVKVYTRAFAAGARRVIWGDFFIEPSVAPERQMQTGLFLAGTWELEPAWFTLRLLSAALDGFERVEAVAPNVHKFHFAARGAVYVVWPAEG